MGGDLTGIGTGSCVAHGDLGTAVTDDNGGGGSYVAHGDLGNAFAGGGGGGASGGALCDGLVLRSP